MIPTSWGCVNTPHSAKASVPDVYQRPAHSFRRMMYAADTSHGPHICVFVPHALIAPVPPRLTAQM